MRQLKYRWAQDGFVCRIYRTKDTGRDYYTDNRFYYTYEVEDTEQGVMFTNSFSPSPMYNQKRMPIIYTALGFALLAPGDTDAEYFENFTSEQLAWLESPRLWDLQYIVPEEFA